MDEDMNQEEDDHEIENNIPIENDVIMYDDPQYEDIEFEIIKRYYSSKTTRGKKNLLKYKVVNLKDNKNMDLTIDTDKYLWKIIKRKKNDTGLLLKDELKKEIIEELKIWLEQKLSEKDKESTLDPELLVKIENIEQKVSNMEKTTKEKEIIPGKLTHAEKEAFGNASQNVKNMYLGENQLTCIKNTLSRSTTVSYMCSYYKNLLNECKSKSKHTTDNKGIFFVSHNGDNVSLALCERPSIRNKTLKDVFQELRNYALCGKCVDFYGTNLHKFVDIVRKTEVCCICKKRYTAKSSNTADNGGWYLCSGCSKDAGESGAQAEKFLFSCVEILGYVFHAHKLVFKKNHSINTECQSGKRYIDCCIFGRFDKTKEYIIVIEKDENQHEKYNKEDDKKKMIDQVNGLLMGRKEANTKLLIIRYNPNGDFDDQNISNYPSVSRLMKLRRWLCWYILNIQKVRKCLVLYMWYNDKSRRSLMASEFNGFAMVNKFPEPVNTGWDWSPEPIESSDRFEGNKNTINVGDAIPHWRFKEDEEQQWPHGIAFT